MRCSPNLVTCPTHEQQYHISVTWSTCQLEDELGWASTMCPKYAQHTNEPWWSESLLAQWFCTSFSIFLFFSQEQWCHWSVVCLPSCSAGYPLKLATSIDYKVSLVNFLHHINVINHNQKVDNITLCSNFLCPLCQSFLIVYFSWSCLYNIHQNLLSSLNNINFLVSTL